MKKIFKNLTPELQGGLLIILAFVVIGPNDVLIPFISKESSLWQFHFSRSLIVISLILIWIYLSSKKIFIPCGFSKLNNIFYKPYYYLIKNRINYFDEIICLSKKYQDYFF